MKYKVKCVTHNYDTLLSFDFEDTAKVVAELHSMLPCNEVKVTDSNGKNIEFGGLIRKVEKIESLQN